MFLVARHKILGLCRHRTFQDAIVCLRDSDHVKASHGRHDLSRQAYSLDSTTTSRLAQRNFSSRTARSSSSISSEIQRVNRPLLANSRNSRTLPGHSIADKNTLVSATTLTVSDRVLGESHEPPDRPIPSRLLLFSGRASWPSLSHGRPAPPRPSTRSIAGLPHGRVHFASFGQPCTRSLPDAAGPMAARC